MSGSRCPLHQDGCCGPSRRQFLARSAGAAVLPALFGNFAPAFGAGPAPSKIRACGPGAAYKPRIKAAFVRRKGEYGMRWPGAVYDGEASRARYAEGLLAEAKRLGVEFDLRAEPVFTMEEAQAWLGEAQAAKADGLMVMVHDRQEHSWPTAYRAVETGIPTIIYSPLGTSFTTNTAPLAGKTGCVVYSTDDFGRALYGMKMLQASAKLRHSRCVVLRGEERAERPLADTGISLRYVPAKTFLETYEAMPESEEIRALARHYLGTARKRTGANEQDVINGAKSYFVAAKLLEQEQGDAISMDCLGALGKSKVSLPCLAWSRMNDDAIPAACEADVGAIASHMIVQALFDRPGFQQDPVAETSAGGIIGAHCSCPTRLRGFDQPPEPFDIKHHHGNRDAVPRTLWKEGERITCLDLLPAGSKPALVDGAPVSGRSVLLVSTGTVLKNLEVPPAGGCVVSVLVKMDGQQEVLSFPGFHQLFFYGDYRRELEDFCRLSNFEARVV